MSPRRGLTVTEIVQTATKIADQQGLTHLSIQLIAQDLGIKSPSLYNHVTGLEEITDLVALESCHTFGEQLQLATKGHDKDTALRNLCHTYIHFAKAHPGQYEAAFKPASGENVSLKAAQDRILEIVVSVLKEFNLEYTRTIHLVRMLRSMLHGFVTLEAAEGFQMPYDLKESVEVMIETFVRGMEG